jgi:hypothetical protein
MHTALIGWLHSSPLFGPAHTPDPEPIRLEDLEDDASLAAESELVRRLVALRELQGGY